MTKTIQIKTIQGDFVAVDKEYLHTLMLGQDGGFTVVGMDIDALLALRHEALRRGVDMPITAEGIKAVFND